MEQSKLDRINELAHIAKQRNLTSAEQSERTKLRDEYISEWRKNTRAVLDNTYVVGSDGIKSKLRKKS